MNAEIQQMINVKNILLTYKYIQRVNFLGKREQKILPEEATFIKRMKNRNYENKFNVLLDKGMPHIHC